MTDFKNYLRKRNLSERTIQTYSYCIEKFYLWYSGHEIEVTYVDIIHYIEYLQNRGLSHRYINQNLKAIEYRFRFLQLHDKVEVVPFRNLVLKGIKRNPIIEPIQMSRLYDFSRELPEENINDIQEKVIFHLIIFQSIKPQEILNLKRGDVDFTKGTVYIEGSKRKNARTLNLDSRQVLLLFEYMRQTREISYRPDCLIQYEGKEDSFFNLLGRMLVRFNESFRIKSWQQVRVSVMTNWLTKHNIRIVQYMCGHKYVSSTERYQMTKTDQLKSALKQFHPFREITRL